MKRNKRIDLGEYIIEIKYDSDIGKLSVVVLDELQDVIDMMVISNDEDDMEDEVTDDGDINIKPELN